jgi:preprotein translocase subunit Sec63
MGAMEQVRKAFGAKKGLYEILGVAKDASQGAIRKAYFRLALTCVSGDAMFTHTAARR